MGIGIGTSARRMTGATGRSAALIAVLVMVLAACQPTMRYHGFAPSDADLEQIVVGRDTRETVAGKIGRPGIGGVMDGSGWFYVQSDWRHTHLRPAVEVDRQVVAISFNERDVVTNVERFGLEDGQVVPLSRRTTTEQPGVRDALARIFRVLGQFSPTMMGG